MQNVLIKSFYIHKKRNNETNCKKNGARKSCGEVFYMCARVVKTSTVIITIVSDFNYNYVKCKRRNKLYVISTFF